MIVQVGETARTRLELGSFDEFPWLHVSARAARLPNSSSRARVCLEPARTVVRRSSSSEPPAPASAEMAGELRSFLMPAHWSEERAFAPSNYTYESNVITDTGRTFESAQAGKRKPPPTTEYSTSANTIGDFTPASTKPLKEPAFAASPIKDFIVPTGPDPTYWRTFRNY